MNRIKKHLHLIILFCITIVYAQKQQPIEGNVIRNFGKFYNIKDIDLNLDQSKVHRVIFDVYTDNKNSKKFNLGINTVARFINMHTANGLNPEQLDLVLVLHGAATKNSLNQEKFKNKFKFENPNTALINALAKANVKIYVCGQSLADQGFKKSELNSHVKMALSALTTLVHYQALDYQIINFN